MAGCGCPHAADAQMRGLGQPAHQCCSSALSLAGPAQTAAPHITCASTTRSPLDKLPPGSCSNQIRKISEYAWGRVVAEMLQCHVAPAFQQGCSSCCWGGKDNGGIVHKAPSQKTTPPRAHAAQAGRLYVATSRRCKLLYKPPGHSRPIATRTARGKTYVQKHTSTCSCSPAGSSPAAQQG